MQQDTLLTVAKKAVASYKRGEDLVLTCSECLLECQVRVESGDPEADGMTWSQFSAKHFVEIKERRVQELLAIAKSPDPKGALAFSRETKAGSVRQTRERQTKDVKPALRSAGFTPSPREPSSARRQIDESLGVAPSIPADRPAGQEPGPVQSSDNLLRHEVELKKEKVEDLIADIYGMAKSEWRPELLKWARGLSTHFEA